MTEPCDIASIWSSIQMDPSLIEGLTFGQLDILVTYVAGDVTLFRNIPVGLLKRIIEKPMGVENFTESIECYKELLNLPNVRAALNRLVNGE